MWFQVLLVAIPFSLAGLMALIRWGWRRSRSGRMPATQYPSLDRLSRVTVLHRGCGVVLGFVVAMVLYFSSWQDGVFLHITTVPAIMGALVIICSSVGELLVFNQARQVGIASLERRHFSSWLPMPLIVGNIVCLAILAFLIGWAVNKADDYQGGRTITLQFYLYGMPSGSGSWGDFPGWYFAWPVIMALVGTLVLSFGAITVVIHRPRNGSDPVLAQWDDALRRRSIRCLCAATLGAVSTTLSMYARWLARFDFEHMMSCYGEEGLSACGDYYTPDLGWFVWPGTIPLLWILAGVSLLVSIYAASIVLGDTIPHRKSQKAEVYASESA